MSLGDRPDTSKPESVHPIPNSFTDHLESLPGWFLVSEPAPYVLAFHTAPMGGLLPLSHTPSSFWFFSQPRRKLEFSQSVRLLLGDLREVFRVWSDGCLHSSVWD